jgi:PKHD-type hydroxylase
MNDMTTTSRQNSPPAILGPFATWQGIFGAEELDALERYGDGLRHQQAALTGDKAGYNQAIRITRVAWIERNAQTNQFYQRMQEIVLQLNRKFFHYDLSGLAPMQYAIYNGSEQGHFDWHTDYGREKGHEQHEPRKLSLSLQLSDGADYQGGELQAQVRSKVDVAPKARGTVIAFPSYVLHRVTPITAGVRKSLVVWALGPEYR